MYPHHIPIISPSLGQDLGPLEISIVSTKLNLEMWPDLDDGLNWDSTWRVERGFNVKETRESW